MSYTYTLRLILNLKVRLVNYGLTNNFYHCHNKNLLMPDKKNILLIISFFFSVGVFAQVDFAKDDSLARELVIRSELTLGYSTQDKKICFDGITIPNFTN